ncbi:MAG: HisA/HisF-related TIM barrel protein [Gammaproteobacteria bacterium]|nr:HisA/HisF-related TIM barrel protein [Gammaproteobacteria bacterium]
MEIIPVIDLMGGIVVRAGGGNRTQYPPLSSLITQYINPIDVIADMLALYNFKKIYIADLDAIFHQQPRWDIYQALRSRFPAVTFLIDAGIQDQNRLSQITELGVIPIIGSETLSDLSLLKDLKRGILSLDFQKGTLLGDQTLLAHPEIWPDTVIAMNIDYIGANKGVDLALLDTIRNLRSDCELIAAGGVRNQQDIELLKQMGISGALVASALHDKRLSF